MFYCPLHNWSSYEKPCPACQQTVTVSSSTQSIKEEPKRVQKRRFDISIVAAQGQYAWHHEFDSGVPLTEAHIIKIKKAIEDAINGIPTPSFINYSLDHKFTQSDMDKAREDAFNASREYTYYDHAHYPEGTNPIAVPSPHRLYPTLESYLNSLKK